MELSLRGRHYETGEVVEVLADGGRIARIGPPTGEPVLGGADVWLAPGLVDVQVNGFAGHNLNADDVTPDTVSEMVRSLWRAGVTLSCPTVTTGSASRMRRSLAAVARAAAADPVVRHAVAGVHVEGPYISPEDGPRGAHPREHVRPPDWDEFLTFQEAAEGLIRIVTLAPETPGAIRFVERAVRAGLVVALGHHGASAEQIRAAVAAGASFATHLGNGAHAMLPRHPNYVWEQLADDALRAGIIVDGHHLPPAVVKCFVRAKGVERLVLVSDAVHVAGLPPGRYEFLSHAVEVSPTGRVSLAGTPYLAGSSLMLCQALANVVAFAGVSLREAVEMATLNPVRLLGLEGRRGGLAVGQPADLLLFRLDEAARRIEVVAVVARGEVVYQV
jgi:N-acetylglucosamine-6-phosphate deacetylase